MQDACTYLIDGNVTCSHPVLTDRQGSNSNGDSHNPHDGNTND